MSSIRHLLLCTALILTGMGCEKTTAVPGPLTGLVGSWNWVLTYNNGMAGGPYTGSLFGDSTTPANSGIHQTLTFNANGTWVLMQNDNLSSQGAFKLDSLPTPAGYIAFLDLVSQGGTDSILNHTISNDTLTLSNPHLVGVGRNWVYVRTASVP